MDFFKKNMHFVSFCAVWGCYDHGYNIIENQPIFVKTDKTNLD
jgi:hypothetical protein